MFKSEYNYIQLSNDSYNLNIFTYNFFPCLQKHMRLLDQIIELIPEKNDVRRYLIEYLTDRIEYNLDPKAQPKLKKNLEYLNNRYYDDGSRIK